MGASTGYQVSFIKMHHSACNCAFYLYLHGGLSIIAMPVKRGCNGLILTRAKMQSYSNVIKQFILIGRFYYINAIPHHCKENRPKLFTSFYTF